MNKKLFLISILIFSFLITTIAFGEGKPVNKMLPAKVEIGNQRDFIEVLWAWEITKALNLDDQRLASILIKLKEINNLKAKTFKEKRALLLELRKALRKNASDEELFSILQKIENLEKNFISNREKILQEIKEMLPVREWAKFVLVNEDFERRVRTLLENIKKFKERPNPPVKKK